ncbi:MAG: hypothetical protein JXA49_01940 [Actinobacteria bacterium]|nr:hypothetical protein [Actinomycetota bacterium]
MRRVVVVLCAISLIACSAFTAGCTNNGDGPEQKQVKEVTDTFMKALNGHDVGALISVVAKKDKKGLEEEMKTGEPSDFKVDYEIGDAKIERDDRATVSVIWKDGKGSLEVPMFLVKEKGKWKVDFEKSMEMDSEV